MKVLIFALALGVALVVSLISVFFIKRLISKRRALKFAASVSAVLHELDMRTEMLPPDLSQTFLYECVMKCRDAGINADARALALDFFVRFFMAYSAQMTPYERIVLIEHSIRKARKWQETESLAEASDEFVETIKEFFIDEMAACPMPRAAKSETVSRVMSL